MATAYPCVMTMTRRSLPTLQDGLGRVRLVAAGICVRPLASLAQVQEPEAPAVRREATSTGVFGHKRKAPPKIGDGVEVISALAPAF
jgi:hypothetical protein